MALLWLKSFHLIFVVTWFAGLFYLPRLFIYHLDAHDETSHRRFSTMERRLLVITHIGAALAVGFGLALLLLLAQTPGYLAQGWLHLKLTLVALLLAFHIYCARLTRYFARGERPHSARFLRVFNELPALVLIAVVLLAVLKPF